MRNKMYAFELVEYVLYVCALAAFCVTTLFHANASFGADIYVTHIALGVVFLCALIRNYVVMMSIDRCGDDPGTQYQFLRGLGPIGRQVERLFRVLIIGSIITTPQGFFWSAYHPLESVSTFFADQHPIFIAAKRSSEQSDIISFYTSLYYYALVTLAVFLLFLAWDLTAAVSVGRRIAERKVSTATDFSDNAIPDPTYRSILLYFNICEHRDRAYERAEGQVSFKSFNTYRAKNRLMVEDGRIVRLYFSSAKAKERLAGLALACFIILAAATNMRIYVAILGLGACVMAYFIYAVANENYWPSIFSFPLLWLTYWVEPSTLRAIWEAITSGLRQIVYVPLYGAYRYYWSLAGAQPAAEAAGLTPTPKIDA